VDPALVDVGPLATVSEPTDGGRHRPDPAVVIGGGGRLRRASRAHPGSASGSRRRHTPLMQ
jgi:hypothetical protein